MGWLKDRMLLGVFFDCSRCKVSVIGAVQNASFMHFHNNHPWNTEVSDTTMQCSNCKYEYDVEVLDGPDGKTATIPDYPEIKVTITGHVAPLRKYS